MRIALKTKQGGALALVRTYLEGEARGDLALHDRHVLFRVPTGRAQRRICFLGGRFVLHALSDRPILTSSIYPFGSGLTRAHPLPRPPRPAPRDADGPRGGERVDAGHAGGGGSPLARLGEEDGLVLHPGLGVPELVAPVLADEALEAPDGVELVDPACVCVVGWCVWGSVMGGARHKQNNSLEVVDGVGGQDAGQEGRSDAQEVGAEGQGGRHCVVCLVGGKV